LPIVNPGGMWPTNPGQPQGVDLMRTCAPAGRVTVPFLAWANLTPLFLVLRPAGAPMHKCAVWCSRWQKPPLQPGAGPLFATASTTASGFHAKPGGCSPTKKCSRLKRF
jgi:hypothetical protein